MARVRLRGLSRDLHLWIGVALFLVLAPLGVTGSVLVYDDALDKQLHPQRYAAPSTPAALLPEVYVEAARGAFAGRAVPAQLRMPQEPGAPVTVTGVGPGRPPAQLTAWLDPASARVLDVANPRQELRGFVHQLHGNLFMAQPGRKLVGWLGVAMFVSCVTGLVIWWPRNNAMLKALRWRRSPSTYSNLHHMAGFWICVPLAVLSFTGAAIAFPDVVRMFSGAARPPGRLAAVAPLATPHTVASDAVQAALDAAGPGRVQQIALPARGDRPVWRIQIRGAGGPLQVMVDDRTGAAKVQPAAPQGPGGGDPLMRLMRRLHDGDETGPVWRAIIVAAGLAPALLGITGVVLWLGRRRLAARFSG